MSINQKTLFIHSTCLVEIYTYFLGVRCTICVFALSPGNRVWTGGQWVQWETRPLHVQGNPLHLRKFPLHFQTCLKVGFKTSPAILLSKIFMEIFQKKFEFFSQILKNTKNQIFCWKRLQTLAQNVHEGKTKVKLLFLQGKVCKITTFFICRGFCRDPLPCSGFILYLHFAGGKSSAEPLL